MLSVVTDCRGNALACLRNYLKMCTLIVQLAVAIETRPVW